MRLLVVLALLALPVMACGGRTRTATDLTIVALNMEPAAATSSRWISP